LPVDPTEWIVRMDRFGHLVYELSLLERAHPQQVCDWVDFPDDRHALLGVSNATWRIDVETGRPVIARALRAVGPLADPGWRGPHLDPARRHRALLWVLLLDLGLYSADMAIISRTRPAGRVPWSYQRIERTGPAVRITVTDGSEPQAGTPVGGEPPRRGRCADQLAFSRPRAAVAGAECPSGHTRPAEASDDMVCGGQMCPTAPGWTPGL
jgi:hypothetical protein